MHLTRTKSILFISLLLIIIIKKQVACFLCKIPRGLLRHPDYKYFTVIWSLWRRFVYGDIMAEADCLRGSAIFVKVMQCAIYQVHWMEINVAFCFLSLGVEWTNPDILDNYVRIASLFLKFNDLCKMLWT